MRQEAFEIRDIRKKEQFVVDDAYLNGYARVCGIYATGVYVALCRHADISNQSCFPSISLIAGKLGISGRQVMRALRVLEDYNIIRRERTEGRRNRYWLIDKKHWKRTSAPQSPVTDRHQCHTDTGAYQPPASACETPVPVPDRHPKDSHRRIHNKENNIYPLPHESGDIPYEEIVSCLNEKTGSLYRPERPKTRRLIKARWKEGFRLEDFRRVIENMAAIWGGNQEMQNYLRPETLFSNKFESYRNWKKGGGNGNNRPESAQDGASGKYSGIGEVLDYEE